MKSYSMGNISLAIFENENNGKVSKSFKISKTYRDKQGEYQRTDSLYLSDLPVVKELIDMVIKNNIRKYESNNQQGNQNYNNQPEPNPWGQQ